MHKINPFDLDRQIELVRYLANDAVQLTDEEWEQYAGLANMLENIRDDFLKKGQQYITLERSEL